MALACISCIYIFILFVVVLCCFVTANPSKKRNSQQQSAWGWQRYCIAAGTAEAQLVLSILFLGAPNALRLFATEWSTCTVDVELDVLQCRVSISMWSSFFWWYCVLKDCLLFPFGPWCQNLYLFKFFHSSFIFEPVLNLERGKANSIDTSYSL